jgi:hypothetical protein
MKLTTTKNGSGVTEGNETTQFKMELLLPDDLCAKLPRWVRVNEKAERSENRIGKRLILIESIKF